MKGKRWVMVLALVIVVLGGAGLTAVAERLPQGSGDGTEPDIALSNGVALENAPDMDGYVGPVSLAVLAGDDGGSSAGELPGQLPAELAQLYFEPQPDQIEGAITTADAGIAWSGFHYKYIAGSAFRPRASTTTWASSGGGGCVYAVAGAFEVFNVPLSLPQGSRIDYLRLYFYDTSASNSTAWVSYYDGAGGLVDLPDNLGVASSGNTGYGQTLSALMEHVVNDANNAYVLNWRPNVAGGTMMLCGMRVAYRLP